MKVLVINCGSSSIKYQLRDVDVDQVLASGVVARIGEDGSTLKHRTQDAELERDIVVPSHREGFEAILQALLHPRGGVLQDISQIAAVGHRTVHGGDAFVESVRITDEVVAKLEGCIPLAPLHNEASLVGIREAQRILPGIPHVAVFDTAFHQTLPPRAYLYALPFQYSERRKIRKYGFHGTSYRYVSQRTAELLGKPIRHLKMIICHMGNGVSMAALDGGRSIDTSMGMTPLEGLVMGTRSGDIDPGIIVFFQRQLGFSADSIDDLLNKESGMLGLSGVGNDIRDIIEKAGQGNSRCQLAVEVFTYRAKKYVGAYTAALGGLDALVFTAGIGENSPVVRRMICDGLEFMGVEVDESRNERTIGTEDFINMPGSRVSVLVIPTDEERVIALDTVAVAGLTH